MSLIGITAIQARFGPVLAIPRYFVYVEVVAWVTALLDLTLSVLTAVIRTLRAGR
jgi:hypothetical protein